MRPHTDPDSPWQFPGGRVGAHAAAEDVLRRLCLDWVGVELDVLLGQPPFEHSFGAYTVKYRFFLCPVTHDEALPCGCADLRWVPAAQLAEYVLDAPSERVAARLQAIFNDR